MLRPESPLTDHRSLLPRRLISPKATIVPANDKRKNRRSLELSDEHSDYSKLLISKTTDSLSNDDSRKSLLTKQDSNDSLKKILVSKQDPIELHKKGIITKTAESLTSSIDLCPQKLKKHSDIVNKKNLNECAPSDDPKKSLIIVDSKDFIENVRKESNNLKTLRENLRREFFARGDAIDSKSLYLNTLIGDFQKLKDVNNLADSPKASDEVKKSEKGIDFRVPLVYHSQSKLSQSLESSKSLLENDKFELSKRNLEKKEVCPRKGLLSPLSEANWREERLRAVKSWYGYGTLPNDSEKVGAGGGGGGGGGAAGSPSSGRSAIELLLGGGLRALAKPVRRAASRDSLAAAHTDADGIRKCSTVLSLTEKVEERPEPIRAFNRLRAPSVCSRCSSLLSLAGVGGSRYSLDGGGGGFVPAPEPIREPLLCKLCLEDVEPDGVTTLAGCGCAFCSKCMREYVAFEVKNGAYEVSCPDAKCQSGGALSLDEVAALLTDDLMQKHLKYRLNHEVAMDQGRAFCPRAGCDTVVNVQAASPAHCPTCRHDFCSLCNREWHGGVSCEAALAGPSGMGAGAPLIADGDLIKCCPMCRVPIEKDEGCAQMMCKRCKHVFCWYCLASLDDDFLLRHYDKGPCKNKLGHSRASVIWHRAQVVGIFAGFGLLLLVASPLLLLAAPCIVCCKCRLCNPNNTKTLEEVEESISLSRDETSRASGAADHEAGAGSGAG